MAKRFRYLAADGGEVEVATSDELVARILAGELTEDMLLYDALSNGWAPARSHEVFLSRITLPREGPSEALDAEPDAAPDLPDLAFTLEVEAAAPDTDEVVSRLLRERNDAPVDPSSARREDLATLPEASAAIESSDPPEEPSRTAPADVPTLPSGAEAGVFTDEDGAAPRETPPGRWAASARSGSGYAQEARYPGRRPPAPRSPLYGKNGRVAVRLLGAAGATMATLAVVLVVAVLADEVETAPRAPAPLPASLATEAPAESSAQPRPGGISASLAATESGALGDMMRGMDSLRTAYGVERVPRAWLEGVYLAHASRYPEVRSFWERYRGYVEEVRDQEEDLFRTSLLATLETQNLSGPIVSIRLARAIRLFEAERPLRDPVYLSMIELADASVELHDLLVAREHEIRYEPVSAGFSREPVIEAVPLTPELRDEMNALLDRIFLSIERVYGDRIAPREELAGALAHGLRSETQ